MLKRHKDLLRSVVADLRATLAGAAKDDGSWLRGDLDRELERLGIAPDGSITPLDALPQATPLERRAHSVAGTVIAEAPRSQSGAKLRGADTSPAAARTDLVERAAYSWINRLLALRTMEARGLIDETLRRNSDYGNISEALYVLRQSEPNRTQGADGGWWAVIDDACRAQATHLPGLFDMNDPVVALRPSVPALRRCIELIGGAPGAFTLAEADAAFADPDAIGWCYQFYQEAAKAQVYAKLGSGGKAATRAEIAAATQLFTEPYMVQWLLQNSLGRSYHEAYPDTQLPGSWAYYIRERPEGQTAPEAPRPLSALDLIDPCCGSGHFLREAFDMFVAMYREQHPEWTAVQIADRVLEQHLHGIDLDPRAAQLAVLTLYLRAWELVRDERRAKRQSGPGTYNPTAMNVATTPSGLSTGALPRHLRRHPEDRVLKPLLEGVFTALEQADILGSLLRPAEHIDAAIKALQQPHTIQMDFDADDAALRRTITRLASSDPAELKRTLLEKVAGSFASEAGEGDVAAALFGREAERGVRLLQLLDRKYTIVATNPPYMGSKNMELPLKKYIEHHFPAGKRDLYSAFILRCLELCCPNGRVSMVTMQGWMFLQSFADLRGVSSEIQHSALKKGVFQGLIREVSFEGLAHLGRYAFSEIGNAVVAPVLFTLRLAKPIQWQSFWSCRLASPRPSSEQAALLVTAVGYKVRTGVNEARSNEPIHSFVFAPRQSEFLSIPGSPILYWLPPELLRMFQKIPRLDTTGRTARGLISGDTSRFLRYFWETPALDQNWKAYVKGGGYRKWFGLQHYAINWGYDGAAIKTFNANAPGGRICNEEFYTASGLTWTVMASGNLGVRALGGDELFDDNSSCVFTNAGALMSVGTFLNSHLATYLARCLSQSLFFKEGYVSQIPLVHFKGAGSKIGQTCIELKRCLTRTDVIERSFHDGMQIQLKRDALPIGTRRNAITSILAVTEAVASVLHTTEGLAEHLVARAYSMQKATHDIVLQETGMPAGFFSLISGYDLLPSLPSALGLPPLPPEIKDFLIAHERTPSSKNILSQTKSRLRKLYEAGPGAVVQNHEETGDNRITNDDEAVVTGADIPIPTETFLEDLSVKMHIHPISVYWLLEELRAEGVRCKPEEKRLLEDRLSVLVLRLLGHRWPKQIEAGEAIPAWADRDGIIPISGGTGETTLAERVRTQLRAEAGDVGAQETEALLKELTNLSLEEWVRREFFKRHVRQFKYRPIAWHLVSDPSVTAPATKGKKGGGKRQPAFECLLYYHACGGDVLARLRTQYVEPLLRSARQQLETATRTKDETTADIARMRVQELEDFNQRLQRVAESGFASPELSTLLADEPLDRWSGDGYLAPANRDDLLRQEQAWHVDLNDGVRVNIAPVQREGLLQSDVLKAVDVKKALADRARWRSDERRWVRAGKLPRCGWLPDSVLESETWNALAPQREAEQMKLAQKRQAAQQRLESDSVADEA